MKKNNIYYINSMCDTAKTRRETHMRSGTTRVTRWFTRRGAAASMFIVAALSVAMLFGCTVVPPPVNTLVATPEVGNLTLRSTTDTATITASVNVSGTLFWVLYESGTDAPADAAAVITAAGMEVNSPIVSRSGADGVVVAAAGTQTITIPSLNPGTQYDFYIALRDAKQAMSLYSSLEIALPAVVDTTAPTFDKPALAGTAAPRSATVTIGNISEGGTLYWALYTDGAAPADAAALITAARGVVGGNIVANSGIRGQVVTANMDASVSLSGLSSGTNYDFYAVIRDVAGNSSTLSEKLDIGTAPDTTAPTFGTPAISQNTAGTSATVTIPNISEDGTLYWALYTDGNSPADAAALITAAQGAVGGNIVANSGRTGQAVTTASVRVSLSGLAFGTAYDFYAVIQDGAGNNSTLSDKLDILTPAVAMRDNTPPTFNAPAIEDNTAGTSATVTIPGISEDGVLYWALYTEGNAPADAAALVTAAQGAVGGNIVANSGRTGQAVTAEASVFLPGLSYATQYDFYAVVQDDEGNTSALSQKLDILTAADTIDPTFDPPIISRNTAGTSAIVTIPNISEGGTLYWVLYRDGSTAPASATALITASQGAIGGAIIDNSGSNGQPVATAIANTRVFLSSLASGTQYDFYVVMQDGAGRNSAISKIDILTPPRVVIDTTPPTFGTPTVSSNTTGISATVTIGTISESGTLYWALYTEGNAPADATALVTAAQGAVTGDIVANSGSRGQAVAASVEALVSLFSLSPSTNYDFYAVIQDRAGNNSLLSDKLDIDTPADTTVPTFGTPVISRNTAGTSAIVTIPNISEDGTLYWVLYRDGTTPASVSALVTASQGAVGGAVVDNSGSSGQTVTSAIANTRVFLSGLLSGTQYDFYAVLRDEAGNNSVISQKLDILTPSSVITDTTPPTFAPPALAAPAAAKSAAVTIGTISESGTLYWALYTDDNAPADAAALVTAARGAVGGVVVANSGSRGQTVTTASTRVSLSGLSSETDYDFYAVIQDRAGNNSLLSEKLDILTAADTTAPTLGTPTISENTAGTSAVVTIGSISESGTLYWVLYADGESPADAAGLITAARGAIGGTIVDNSGSGGQAVTTADARVFVSGLSLSTQYDFYAVLQDEAGNTSTLSAKLDIGTPSPPPDNTAPTFGAPALTNTTFTSATVTIGTISENGTLYWALYTDGNAPASAAALVTAAGGTPSGNVVANSGSRGQTVRATVDAIVSLSGLSTGTQYDFYAVVQDGAGNNSALSAKLDIGTTADTTAPTFAAPVLSENTAGISAVVTIGNISEDGTLYWVLYTDGNSAANAAALVTAAGGTVENTVSANSGSSGQAVTSAANALVSLSGLSYGTEYDFYAVIQDAAGNNSAVSDKLDILTPDLYGCRPGETYNRETGACGMTVNTCPTGQILVGSTCQAKPTCTSSQLYIASRNTCVPREYGFAIGNRAGSINITVDPTGKVCTMSGTFSVPLTSTDLTAADLRALATGLANNVYQADIFDVLGVQLSGTTIPIRFTVDATNVELDGQIVTDNLPAIPFDANSFGTHQLRLDTSNIFPATGTVIDGVPGRYGGGGSGTVLMGIANYIVQSTNC